MCVFSEFLLINVGGALLAVQFVGLFHYIVPVAYPLMMVVCAKVQHDQFMKAVDERRME